MATLITAQRLRLLQLQIRLLGWDNKIQKSNPNHDERGRFDTGASTASFAKENADEDADNETEEIDETATRNKENASFLKLALLKQRVNMSSEERDKIDAQLKNTQWNEHTTAGGNVLFVDSKKDVKHNGYAMELRHVGVLADLGFDVYLLGDYNNNNAGGKSADAIINKVRVELKYVMGTLKTTTNAYKNGLQQCKNVSMYISDKSSVDNKDLYKRRIKGSAKVDTREKGLLITFFEKTKEFVVEDMSCYNT